MELDLHADRLGPGQVQLAAGVLVRAFRDEPFCRFAFPDEADREAGLQAMFEGAVTAGLETGEVYTIPPDFAGVSVWIAPGRFTPNTAGGGPGDEAPGRASRLARAVRFLSGVHLRHAPEPHWYLLVIGVDPGRQRQGIGTALIEPVLRLADGGGTRCYLETSKETNIPFYERLGFRAVEHVVVDAELDSWSMLRDPR